MNSFKISIIKAEKQVTELNKCGKQSKVKICEKKLSNHIIFINAKAKSHVRKQKHGDEQS
jgi:hypothetical protein